MVEFIEKIKSLPQPLRDFTFSDIPMLETKKSFAGFGVDSALSEKITKEIGLMYVGDIDLAQLPEVVKKNIGINENISFGIAYEINRRIFAKFPDCFKNSAELLQQWELRKASPVLNDEVAWAKVLEQEPWIAEILREEKKEEQVKTEKQEKYLVSIKKLSLVEAIRQYPKIAEQPITGSPIRLKSFPAPARPSVKNWISDYRETLGAGRHGMVERGNYLFQSENTRKINSAERQKLAWVLKSLEESVPLDIDSENEIIIFPEPKEPAREPVPKYPAAEAPKTPFQNPVAPPARAMGEISSSPSQIKDLPKTEAIKPEPPKVFPQNTAANVQPSASPKETSFVPPKPAEEKRIHYQKTPLNRIKPIGNFEEENGNGNVVNLKELI